MYSLLVEVAVRRRSKKQLVQKLSQNLQKNTCSGVVLVQMQA